MQCEPAIAGAGEQLFGMDLIEAGAYAVLRGLVVHWRCQAKHTHQ